MGSLVATPLAAEAAGTAPAKVGQAAQVVAATERNPITVRDQTHPASVVAAVETWELRLLAEQRDQTAWSSFGTASDKGK
jgi:PHD/YefM family antitoxin component YafN of YafNO toxin-antitoxin module